MDSMVGQRSLPLSHSAHLQPMDNVRTYLTKLRSNRTIKGGDRFVFVEVCSKSTHYYTELLRVRH
jgi:hypothetical protein